jgi:hypothetical protein
MQSLKVEGRSMVGMASMVVGIEIDAKEALMGSAAEMLMQQQPTWLSFPRLFDRRTLGRYR